VGRGWEREVPGHCGCDMWDGSSARATGAGAFQVECESRQWGRRVRSGVGIGQSAHKPPHFVLSCFVTCTLAGRWFVSVAICGLAFDISVLSSTQAAQNSTPPHTP
jgi:hypothetical protein